MSASTHLAAAGAARGTAWSTPQGSEPALVTRRTPVTRIFSPNLASFHPLTLPDFGLHPLRALPWSRMTCPFSPPDRPSIAAKTLLPCGARTHACRVDTRVDAGGAGFILRTDCQSVQPGAARPCPRRGSAHSYRRLAASELASFGQTTRSHLARPPASPNPKKNQPLHRIGFVWSKCSNAIELASFGRGAANSGRSRLQPASGAAATEGPLQRPPYFRVKIVRSMALAMAS